MSKIRLQPGEIVELGGTRYEVVSMPSGNKVKIKNLETEKTTSASPSNLKKPKEGKKTSSLSFDMPSAKQKNLAKKSPRKGGKIAQRGGKLPKADFPLAVVQIDHTKLDLELVNNKKELSLGRPNLIVAMDVFSRAVLGFFLSFESVPPLTTGLCLEHAMFSKDEWLERRGITNPWPMCGKPTCLQVDNSLASRFNGLQEFCGEYGVKFEYRPVLTLHYDGHIEHLLHTIAEQIHTMPGTTLSNIKRKGEYSSAKKAIVTLYAFEQWLGEYFTGVYHNEKYSDIDMSPLEKWKQGMRETKKQVRVGVPSILSDRAEVHNLLLPVYERSLQRYGIRLDHIQYSSPALSWMRSERAKEKNKKVKIKRDPRDISEIKAYDETRRNWLAVPYRDIRHPSTSLWEWQAVRKTLKGKKNERIIFDALRL